MNFNIIVISPFKNDKELYPHIRHVVNLLSENSSVEYYYFKERGLDFEKKVRRIANKKYDIRRYYFIFEILYEIIKLRIKIKDQNKTVIAIDNFIYVISNIIGIRNTILWSHDFIGYDEKGYSLLINKFSDKKTKKYLSKKGKIIIQDKERFEAFSKTIEIDSNEIQPYFLPVSLLPSTFRSKNKTIPSVIQIGGINTNRSSSHIILNAFQSKNIAYNLTFHGYIHDSIMPSLDKAKIKPIISNTLLSPEDFDEFLEKHQIGFLSYNINTLNFYYIKFATNQLVEFLRIGMPVISFGNSNLNEFVESNLIGISIIPDDNFKQKFEFAINELVNNYSKYSTNAITIFNKYYNLKNYQGSLVQYLYYTK